MYRIYGYDDCPFCRRAKKLLTEENLDHDYVAIMEKEARTLFLDQRGFKDPDRTFPRVYKLIRGEEVLVGGYADLELHIVLNG